MTDAAPQLSLRLPGMWVQLDPARPDVTDRRIRAFVELSMGRADELASARAKARGALGVMVERADGPASLQSTFLCHEVEPGVLTPIAVSVFTPAALHLSPVVGTRAADVMDGFLAAMDAMGDGEGWHRGAAVDGEWARRWNVSETSLGGELDDLPIRSFGADYWRTVPGSKRMVLITVTSPLADIPQTLLRLADAIVSGSRVAP